MTAPNEHPEAARLQQIAARHISGLAAARRGLAARRNELVELVAVLEETLDQITPAYQRYRIRRWLEQAMLLVITVAEVIVAETVVQALGLSATSAVLVAIVVGGAATGLAWLAGHERAVAHDPQAMAAGRRSWLGATVATAGVFLLANLTVRVYSGLLAEQANQFGTRLVAPLLAGLLLTAITTALMVVAAFIAAHAETAKEAELRRRLRKLHQQLGTLDDRIGVVNPKSGPVKHLAVVGDRPAGPAGVHRDL